MEERLEKVLMALVDPPREADRERIDADKIRELAESIRERGLLEPVQLRPVNGRYEIVFGHRRYLAHKFLGLVDIKAIIKETCDCDVAIDRAVENLQREDLTPIEQAKAYRRMMDQGGMTRFDVAKRTGVTHHTIDKYLAFLKLAVCIQEALDRGQISMDVARTLGEFDDADMVVYYTKMAVENGVTAAVVRMWLDDYFKSKEGTLYDSVGSDPLASAVVEPTKNYTACNVCQDPVEIAKAIHLIICPGCREKVRTLRQSK